MCTECHLTYLHCLEKGGWKVDTIYGLRGSYANVPCRAHTRLNEHGVLMANEPATCDAACFYRKENFAAAHRAHEGCEKVTKCSAKAYGLPGITK